MKNIKFLLLPLLLFLLPGCTYYLHKDFNVYLQQHPTDLGQTKKQTGYSVDESTKNLVYEFRSFATGIANKWVINVGDMLLDYIDTTLINAFEKLEEDVSKKKYPLHIYFKINNYEYADFQAYVEMNISVFKNGTLLFKKDYSAEGQKQFGKVFWGGTWAQRNAVHQSTQYAFDAITNAFLADLQKKL